MLYCQSWKYTESCSSKQQDLSAGACWASTAGSTQKQLNWNLPHLTFLFGISCFSNPLFPKSGSYCCTETAGCLLEGGFPMQCDPELILYLWSGTVSCESRVQRPHLKPFGPAESQVGMGWNLSWLHLVLPAGDGHGKGWGINRVKKPVRVLKKNFLKEVLCPVKGKSTAALWNLQLFLNF